MRRLYNLLRSRKLAFWLIGLFTAYATVATILAEGDFERAYANPVFFLLAATLAAATAACAGERTAGAVRAWRAGSGATPAFVERLERSPQIAIPLGADADASAAIGEAATSLRQLGLRAHVGKSRLHARTSPITLVGSPLFHWALVAIFLLVAGGRLTRSEGMIGVPIGATRVDEPASYGTLTQGPFSGSFSGLTIAVPELTFGYKAGGIERGVVPTVELYRGDQRVAAGRVYPNSPLRRGSIMVHSAAYGLAGDFSLVTSTGTQQVSVFYDFAEEGTEARNSVPLAFDRNGKPVVLASSVPLDVDGDIVPWVLPADPRVVWSIAEGGAETTGTLAPGASLDLGDGASLTFNGLSYYARISVVDDWSVYPLYIAFGLALLGLALALLLPPRAVWVMLVERDGELALHARTRQARADRTFAQDVEAALRRATGGEDTFGDQ